MVFGGVAPLMAGKIGIAAVTYKDNFGSALQTYATQQVLEQLGFKTAIFDIRGVHRSIFLRKIVYYLSRLFQPDEHSYLIESLKSRARKRMQSPGDAYARNMAVRHGMYEAFNRDRLRLMPKAASWAQLREQSRQCEYVVVGSDQLWRPSNIVGGYYTLEFVPDEVKKIAYATSFGTSVLPKALHKKAARFLQRIDCISVRENSGRTLVKELTGRDIPVVCDPTMLLDAAAWQKIQPAAPRYTEPYILCYFMGADPAHRDFVKRLQKETGYKIVGLLHGSTYLPQDDAFADEAPYDIGPGEFVSLVRHAQYICTDSFHATVFSILHARPFFVFRRFAEDSAFSTNDRLHTLLSMAGLEERLLTGQEDAARCRAMTIDYPAVLDRVARRRAESMAYLTAALDQ